MPELPEVETLLNQFRERILGRHLSRLILLQDAVLGSARDSFGDWLTGHCLDGLSRKGKYLRFHFSSGTSLWFHLGMTGQLLFSEKPDLGDPHLHLVLEFRDMEHRLLFRDVRRFGEVFTTEDAAQNYPEGISKLGPEPFDLDDLRFAKIFKSRTGRIKSLLLNQRILSGLGNIYADESLFRAGIHPLKRPFRVSVARLRQLHRSICEVLKEAIENGGSSIDDYLHVNGESGRFQNSHRVYGKAGTACLRCGNPIRKLVIAGRSASFCSRCQK